MGNAEYDPFAAGHHEVAVRTIEANDATRDRRFPVEIWCPAIAEAKPLIVFSHYSGGHRRTATYLCTHLASHGYVVAAMDHSEVVAPELTRRAGETASERAAGIDDIIASRVPDGQFFSTICLAVQWISSSTLRASDWLATASVGGRCWRCQKSMRGCERWLR